MYSYTLLFLEIILKKDGPVPSLIRGNCHGLHFHWRARYFCWRNLAKPLRYMKLFPKKRQNLSTSTDSPDFFHQQFRTSKSCNSPEVGNYNEWEKYTYNSEQGHMAVVDLYFVCHKSATSLMLIYLIDATSGFKTRHHLSFIIIAVVLSDAKWQHKTREATKGLPVL